MSAVGSVVSGATDSQNSINTTTPQRPHNQNTTVDTIGTSNSTPSVIRQNIMQRRSKVKGGNYKVQGAIIDSDDDEAAVFNMNELMKSNDLIRSTSITSSANAVISQQERISKILYDMAVFVDNETLHEKEDNGVTKNDVATRLKIISLILTDQFSVEDYNNDFIPLKELQIERENKSKQIKSSELINEHSIDELLLSTSTSSDALSYDSKNSFTKNKFVPTADGDLFPPSNGTFVSTRPKEKKESSQFTDPLGIFS